MKLIHRIESNGIETVLLNTYIKFISGCTPVHNYCGAGELTSPQFQCDIAGLRHSSKFKKKESGMNSNSEINSLDRITVN